MRRLFPLLLCLLAPLAAASAAGAMPSPQQSTLAGLATSLRHAHGHVRVEVLARPRLPPARGAAVAVSSALLTAIAAAGGRDEQLDAVAGGVRVTLPAASLRGLARRGDVQAISLLTRELPLMLSDDAAAVGAPAFWNAGLTGGLGAADVAGANLAILQDKIQEDHPALAGVAFVRPPGAPVGACGSGCEHGTAVASVAVSQGVSSCPAQVAGCSSADAQDLGVAHGAAHVLDAASYGAPSGMDTLAWALGLAARAAGTGTTIAGASTPAQVLNDSHGDVAVDDDDASAQTYDKAVSQTGATYVAACGNAGPAAATVNTPGISYDSLCVGSVSSSSGAIADTQVDDFSSRGPTPAGRKKPDLVAVGDTQAAWQHWNTDGTLWHRFTGTSLAAPQVAGAATLLAGAGVRTAAARKALLINSARLGRSTPAAAMGTQSGWQPDWGWGMLDLGSALGELHDVADGAVTDQEPALFATTPTGDGRVTLTWNRRATGTWGAGGATTAMTLTNLDLQLRAATTGATISSSTSTIDNVEQARGVAGLPAVVKVYAASSIAGADHEPFALASGAPLRRLQAPRPTVSLSATPAIAAPGQPIVVTATITNPSGDLAGDQAAIDLQLPAGAHTADLPHRALGTLMTGQSTTTTWTITAETGGPLPLTAAARTSAYGDTYTTATSTSATIDADAPQASATIDNVTSSAAQVRWSAGDALSGLSAVELELSRDAGATWAPLTTNGPAGVTTIATAEGEQLRVRIRARDAVGNLGAWLESTTRIVPNVVAPPASSPRPLDPAPQPDGDPASPTSSGWPTPPTASMPRPRTELLAAALKLTKPTQHGRRVCISGTIASAATGKVALQLVTSRGAIRASTQIIRGRFAVEVSIKRGARLEAVRARYAGNEKVAASAATRR